MKWLLSQVADATQGRLIGNDVEVTGVSTDTRTVADGQLFIALSGERFDAHDFLDQAITAGATALLVSDESKLPAGCSAVVVDDTRLALGRLAAAWRARFSLPVIAIRASARKWAWPPNVWLTVSSSPATILVANSRKPLSMPSLPA